MKAHEVDEIIARVAKRNGKQPEDLSRPKPKVRLPPMSVGRSRAQLDVENMTQEQQAAYWLELMAAG